VKRIAPSLSDQALDHQLSAVVRNEDTATAIVLDHIAEYDIRKLFRPAGYSSMFAYCVGQLHRSEVAAYKRIRAARAARRFPAIFDAITEGRLHLSAVVLLAPHLTESTAGELLAAAAHKTTKQVEQLLADRFPRPDMPTQVLPVGQASTAPAPELTLRSVDAAPQQSSGCPELTLRSAPTPPAPAPAEDRPTVKPLAPQRFALQCTIDQETHDALRHAQELLGHELPSGDVAQVLKMALQTLIPQLEKRRFSATTRPRPRPGRRSENPRHIPAHIQRAVWQRDKGQCTYVSANGHRCQERKFVELDHMEEVARGGQATSDNLRLRCRAHNQYAAECTFGAEFMCHKRVAAAAARAENRTRRSNGQLGERVSPSE
jgi:5-methylcytosine-specific restriction endonuclease McrA